MWSVGPVLRMNGGVTGMGEAGGAATPELVGGIDRRSVRVGVLLGMVALLNVVDLGYTLFAHRMGMLNEMNPLAATFLSQGLEPSLVSFKALMVLAGATIIWKVRWSRWSIGGCWVLIGAYTWLGVMWYCWTQEVIHTMEDRLFLSW